jgi:acyl carrier protein
MKKNNLEIKLKKIFQKIFQISENKILTSKINQNSKWDSLTHINLILEIEKSFKIKKINNKAIVDLNSFKKVFQYLKKSIK